MLALLLLNMSLLIVYPAVALASICYAYKFVEFIKNRYCDRDVRIVLIYKIALFHLLEETCLQNESSEV